MGDRQRGGRLHACGRTKVHAYIKQRRIKSIKRDGTRLVDLDSVDEMMTALDDPTTTTTK